MYIICVYPVCIFVPRHYFPIKKKFITYKAGFIILILQMEQMKYKDGNLDTVL